MNYRHGQEIWSLFGDCLFGEVKLTKNADPDKNGDSCYGLGLDIPSQFSLWND